MSNRNNASVPRLLAEIFIHVVLTEHGSSADTVVSLIENVESHVCIC